MVSFLFLLFFHLSFAFVLSCSLTLFLSLFIFLRNATHSKRQVDSSLLLQDHAHHLTNIPHPLCTLSVRIFRKMGSFKTRQRVSRQAENL